MDYLKPGDEAPESGIYLVVHRNGESVEDWRRVTKGQPMPSDVGAFWYQPTPLSEDDAAAAELMIDARANAESDEDMPRSFGHALAMIAVRKAQAE